jgi:hypothetical protein
MSAHWAVALEGDKFDLEDWLETLKAPFDPAVATVMLSSGETEKTYILRSRQFEGCSDASEVREIVIPLIRHLNALMAVYCDARPVRNGAIVQEMEDGSFRRHIFAEMSAIEIRSKIHVHAVGMVLGGRPPPPPSASSVQAALASASENMLSGLEHYSRADNWHDLFKAFEALEHECGGEHGLKKAARSYGVSDDELKAFGRAADRVRHHQSNAKGPGMSLPEGRRLVGRLFKHLLNKP